MPADRLIRVRAAALVLALMALRPVSGGATGAQSTDTARQGHRDTSAIAPRDSTAGTTAGGGRSSGGPPTPDSTRGAGTPATAAIAPTEARSPTDTALQRVHALVGQGQMGAARALVDSLIASTPPGSIPYASVLYARATLATNADSAENDYRRLTVEYPGSARAADALLRLAQLELARGDRQQAAVHLDRLTREQAPDQTGVAAARTQLQVGLAYVDLQDLMHACAAFTAARAAAPSTDVELLNRIDYNTQRCAAVALTSASPDTAHGGRAASAPGAGRPGADSVASRATKGGTTTPRRGAVPSKASSRAAATPATAPPAAGAGNAGRRLRMPGYTIQVAAYDTRAAATALVGKLDQRGYVARIYGASPPFRVRIGRFVTEAQADSAAQSLKRKGITGFVTPGEPPEI
jgi:TolA-binding protein